MAFQLRFLFLVGLVLFCNCTLAADIQLDTEKYIPVDQIKAGMDAYCLTVYEGTKIERFDLDVIGVMLNDRPGRDHILVQGTDERFIHTGPVKGCSGSPVYIEGRLAGALSGGFSGSQDPLYIVTPIADMLEVGTSESYKQPMRQPGFAFDLSVPIDLEEIDKQLYSALSAGTGSMGGYDALVCPLVTSGLSIDFDERINGGLKSLGLAAVAGLTGQGQANGGDVKLQAGSAMAVPVVTGDIKMTVIGTVTEVDDDTVYALGHGWMGYGAIDLPMATAEIYTVVSHILSSFKMGSAIEIVGALNADEKAGVAGTLGSKAKMIPMNIKIDRYNDIKKRSYSCEVAKNRMLSPLLAGAAVGGASLQLGKLPPYHTIDYKVKIGTKDSGELSFDNVSSGAGINEMAREIVDSIALLMNNPYEMAEIETLDFEVKISDRSISSRIWSVEMSDVSAHAGDYVSVSVVLDPVLAGKRKYELDIQIPSTVKPGSYELLVTGSGGYIEFLRKAVPFKFIAENLESIVEVLNEMLGIRRDRLYCLLVLPSGGVSLAKAELPDLPASKALILGDAKRALKMKPYPQWVQRDIATGMVVSDKRVMRINVLP